MTISGKKYHTILLNILASNKSSAKLSVELQAGTNKTKLLDSIRHGMKRALQQVNEVQLALGDIIKFDSVSIKYSHIEVVDTTNNLVVVVELSNTATHAPTISTIKLL